MKILGIETSTRYLSVAIAEDEKILASLYGKDALQHATLLIPTIDKALKKSALKLKNIDAIAVSIGPGSFTGLRIGIAVCKGINIALGIPLLAVPTLDAIAHNFVDEKEDMLCPIIDAKKGKVYTALYKKQGPERITDYMLTGPEELLRKIDKPTLLFGDGIKLHENLYLKNPFVRISRREWFPKASVVARLGLVGARKKKFNNPDKLVPMYLHSKYCQIKGVPA